MSDGVYLGPTEPVNRQDVEDDDFDQVRERSKWAMLVDTTGGGWLITKVTPGGKVGEYETDLCNKIHDYRIGAFFDQNVEELLDAMAKIGGGGLEADMQINGLLSGICRSFVEATDNLKKWRAEISKE